MAQNAGLDLVEIAATAVPPVCRIVDYGKFKYELSKKEKEGKKHQHSSEVKEIQLSPTIDPHDLGIKMDHATEFLCEDMKVKVSLRFRGRQMAHTEVGMGVVVKFLRDLAPWGHPDNQPKLVGRSINVMISPLPKQKRAKHPRDAANAAPAKPVASDGDGAPAPAPRPPGGVIRADRVPTDAASKPASFGESPFSGLDAPPPAP